MSKEENDDLTINEIEGKWFINMSTFPMWLKGDKKNPTFNYQTQENGKLSDVVLYEKKGKIKSIRGTDTLKGRMWIWRGKGWLKIAKSQWEIIYYDRENTIAIVRFAKTLFTPAGYDVISRDKSLTPEQERSIREFFPQMGIDELLSVIRQD